MNFEKEIETVKTIVASQNRWRGRECINMIAAENVTSPLVDEVYNNDFSHRYCEGEPYKRFYGGTKYADEIEQMTLDLAKKLFVAKQADVRPISATVANMATISMFSRPGDTIITNSTPGGGHITHNLAGASGLLNRNPVSFPTTEDMYHIDADATIRLIEKLDKNVRNHLSLLIFGCSMFLFPQPVKEIAPVAKAHNIKIMYDGAHVFGLIAGKQFQDPLREGSDVLVASTHKTFAGPQGGIILGNFEDDEWSRYKPCIFPGVVSNYHAHRYPALAITLLEYLKFGEDYAKQIVKNAKAFAQALAELGIGVEGEKFGYTESHQVILDVSALGGGKKCEKLLEESNIIVNRNLLPKDPLAKVHDPSGIRSGVQEMTRMGMKESEMKELANFFKKVLVDGKNCKDDVISFRKDFQKVHYTF